MVISEVNRGRKRYWNSSSVLEVREGFMEEMKAIMRSEE